MWFIDIRHKGTRIRRSAKTRNKHKAQEYHDKVKAELWEQDKLQKRPEYLWDDAIEKWLIEKQDKASFKDDVQILRWLHPYLSNKKLKDITRTIIMDIANVKKEETSSARANRYLALIQSILRRAERVWEWLDKAPAITKFKEIDRRIRWLTPKQAEKLIEALPPHLSVIARFALLTGLRRGNILKLEWDQVDLENQRAWIHADMAKTRKPIPVALNDSATDLLKKQVGKNKRYCFPGARGGLLTGINSKAWKNALEKAGLEDFRFHDLRHTWASWHVQNGTPLYALQEMAGWTSPQMVRRYAHLASDHLIGHAQKVDKFWSESVNPNAEKEKNNES
ncbi:site-specific integrase [Magnetococcales bacterium HHB-1]